MLKTKRKVVFISLFASSLVFANNTTKLDEITVSETGGNYLSGNNAYYKTRTQSATKTDTPIRETAQSVQVITKEIFDDLNIAKINDALDYVSGISRQNNFGGAWDNFSIRGFSGHENTGMSMLKNGFADNRGFNASRDSANIQSMEVLKGTSGSLYGNSEPGGTINIVTKQPNFENQHSIKADVGSYDFYRVALDTTAPINDSFAYRLNVAAEKKGSFRNYVDSQRYIVAPSLLWAINDDTFVSYIGEFIEQKAPMDRGISLINGQNIMNPKTFLGNPNSDDMNIKDQTHQLKFEHYFNDSWVSRSGIAYKDNSFKGSYANNVGKIDNINNPVFLQSRYSDYNSKDIQFQSDIKGEFDIGSAKNTILFGAETYRFTKNSLLNRKANAIRVDNIDSHPTYTILNTNLDPHTNRYEKEKGISVFVQDELAYKDFRFTSGFRYDEVKMDNLNRRNNSSTEQNDYALSPRIGITYLINDMWSVYATSGTSFRPNAGTNKDGETFESEKGVSIETGLKFESEDKRFGSTLAIYQIEKKNVLTKDPTDDQFSIAAGKVKSKGVELDLNGKITDNIKLNVNYSYTNAKVIKDNTYEGKELLNVPKNSASLLLMWEDSLSQDSSYGIGAGATYMGKKAGNYMNDFYLPSYTTAKLVSYYKVNKNLDFRLNIDNLFDKEYIASSYDSYWLTPGNPRTATLSMTYKF
ncbi:TonB-dependent siderophore receptor [Aliarcobacter vitoriensis]|uniref:TonB-dependent siderophore receptor n=1 Tax=Aliarcobacter vitoriensis TaxID=2011099 RepID=UPI003AAB3469